jgi:hypothetical protein
MLDTSDRFLSRRPEITCIEPFTARLNRLLREDDKVRLRIIESRVQDVPIETLTSLGPGDLLFIDSSHVMKCGSDVQHLMFEVLPRLPAGIFVHFHDVFDSFEYPADWLLKGRYWNEAYMLRAFLTSNSDWDIYFFNSYVARVFRDFLSERMPICLLNTGGSLYLQRTRKGQETFQSQ